MIELSAEQRQAIAQGEAVRIIDPLTQGAYVLLRGRGLRMPVRNIAAIWGSSTQSGDLAADAPLATGILA